MADKASFNGETKIITILAGVTEINVAVDLYTAFLDYYRTDEGSRYLPAFDTSGGDPLDLIGEQFSPQFFFLKNGWRVEISTGEHVHIRYNLFTFNTDGVIYNLSNSSSPIPYIDRVPVVVKTESGTTDLAEVNAKLDAIQASILLIKEATDNLNFDGTEVLAKLDESSKQAIRDSLAMQLSVGVIIEAASIDDYHSRFQFNPDGDIKATLDGEKVSTDDESREASKADLNAPLADGELGSIENYLDRIDKNTQE